jgi:hypothetical protein
VLFGQEKQMACSRNCRAKDLIRQELFSAELIYGHSQSR